MRSLIWILLAALAGPAVTAAPPPASYVIRLGRTSPPAFVVNATWPGGTRLEMDTTRPGDLPELLERGWPALVTRLRVTDASGKVLDATPDGDGGWRLPDGTHGAISAEYEVDTRLLAENAWPAPREAVFADEADLSIVGRALFVTTDAMLSSTVRFDLPPGWRPYAPWETTGGARDASFGVSSVERLRENLVVLTRRTPIVVDAAGFEVVVVPMGDWRRLDAEIRRVVRAHVRHFVELMAFRGNETYMAILLPMRDRGAESYRQSLALTFPDEPSRANKASWANLIGHEIFHYWNGWRLRGADYSSSQWFQEGFTEYAANVSTVAAGRMSPTELRAKLAEHVANYRRLATSLENPGNRKGPPLYSGGALVAFSWDVSIREATEGARGLGDFLRALWRQCEDGERSYTRDDIVKALRATAERDWTSFLDTHVRGTAPLPIEAALAGVGLRLIDGTDGNVAVVEEPTASAGAKRTWRRIVRGK